MKFEDIKRVNETIRTTGIERKDKNGKTSTKEYAEVNQRIKAFRMLYPEGTILTEIISIDNGTCIMKATIKNGELILGTGTAYENENSTFINKTSYIENCETSAVGRALAMCGIGIDTSIASKEEMENAIKQQETQEQEQQEKLNVVVKIKKLISEKKVLPNEISEHFGKSSGEMDLTELKDVIKWLEEK